MQTLKNRNDFQRLRLCTQKTVGKYFIVVYLLDFAAMESKVGITVSKKIGNAVVRNKTKRRIRAFLREYSFSKEVRFLCNIIALPSVVNAEWVMFKNDLKHCLDKICN